MDQNLSLYRIFYSVANTGNISHSAKELYISQPAISKAIRKLEDSLDTTLFIRSSRGVHLTEEGKILYEHVKNAFHSISLGEANLKQINELGIGHIRIGVSTTLCKYVLLPYLKSFIEAYPHVKITIDCQSTFHTLKLLEANKIDIGLICKSDNTKNIDFFSIGEIEDIFVATKTYIDNLRLREQDPVRDDSSHATSLNKEDAFLDIVSQNPNHSCNDITLFKDANLMLLDKDNITRVYIDHYFEENNIEINQILEINNMDLLIEFAKIGLGVACVIKEFVLDDLKNKSIVEIPLTAPINKRTIGFAYSKNADMSESMKNFIHFYKNKK